MLSETSQVTILVPTLNRSGFVLRLLDYYRDNNFAGCILIGDSSTAEHLEPVQKRVAELASVLNVVHVPCPELDTNTTLARLIAMINTPYVAYAGDDDYIVPAAIEQCVTFLNAHPDYVAAQGTGRTFELDRAGAYGQLRFTGPYPLRGNEQKTAAYRLAWHLRDYTVTIFAVHRTDVWRKMWALLDRVPDRAFSAELLPACLSVVYGKMRLLNVLYLLRQGHPGTYHLAHTLDWFASPEWGPSYRLFLDTLASEVSRLDGTSKNDAELLVRGLFHEYLFAHRNSLSYRAERFRMNAVTRMMPFYVSLDRWLPPRVVRMVRVTAVALFTAPFAIGARIAAAPLKVLQWFDQRRANLADVTSRNSTLARRAAERSASTTGATGTPPDA